jgi:hypothetical protein
VLVAVAAAVAALICTAQLATPWPAVPVLELALVEAPSAVCARRPWPRQACCATDPLTGLTPLACARPAPAPAGFDDPEVMAAVNEIAANPASMKKHEKNPKVGCALPPLLPCDMTCVGPFQAGPPASRRYVSHMGGPVACMACRASAVLLIGLPGQAAGNGAALSPGMATACERGPPAPATPCRWSSSMRPWGR